VTVPCLRSALFPCVRVTAVRVRRLVLIGGSVPL
jgi:hypothetical protein